jgi:hypothetical protein
MRKWPRRIFWTAWSLLLIAIATILIRSYWYADQIGYSTDTKSPPSWNKHYILIGRGRLGFISSVFHPTEYMTHKRWFHDSSPAEEFPWDWFYSQASLKILGFGVAELPYLTPSSILVNDLHVVILPIWSLLLPLSVPPALLLLRVRRRKIRLRRGLCPTCGYDLRATPDKCPECGAPSPSQRA